MQQIFFAVLSLGLLGCVLCTPAASSTVIPTSATNGTNTTEVPTTNFVTSSAKMSTAHGGSSNVTTNGTNITTPGTSATSSVKAGTGSSGTTVTSHVTGGLTTQKPAATTHGTGGGAESVWRTSALVAMAAIPLLKMLGAVH